MTDSRFQTGFLPFLSNYTPESTKPAVVTLHTNKRTEVLVNVTIKHAARQEPEPFNSAWMFDVVPILGL